MGTIKVVSKLYFKKNSEKAFRVSGKIAKIVKCFL